MASVLEGNVLALSLQMYGCRVVQKVSPTSCIIQGDRLTDVGMLGARICVGRPASEDGQGIGWTCPPMRPRCSVQPCRPGEYLSTASLSDADERGIAARSRQRPNAPDFLHPSSLRRACLRPRDSPVRMPSPPADIRELRRDGHAGTVGGAARVHERVDPGSVRERECIFNPMIESSLMTVCVQYVIQWVIEKGEKADKAVVISKIHSQGPSLARPSSSQY